MQPRHSFKDSEGPRRGSLRGRPVCLELSSTGPYHISTELAATTIPFLQFFWNSPAESIFSDEDYRLDSSGKRAVPFMKRPTILIPFDTIELAGFDSICARLPLTRDKTSFIGVARIHFRSSKDSPALSITHRVQVSHNRDRTALVNRNSREGAATMDA